MNETVTIVDSAFAGVQLRSGGESDIYKLFAPKGEFILKWYKQGLGFKEDVIQKLTEYNGAGCYRIREYGKKNGCDYLIYNYVEGVTADRLTRENGRVPVVPALQVLRQITHTLNDLNSRWILHGDLNPSNVLLSDIEAKNDGSDCFRAVLVDFGIEGPGTPAYAAPERLRGAAPTVKSELFSLGLLLYRFITGVDLLRAKTYEEYATAGAGLNASIITERIYLSDDPLNVHTLSVLEPLWKGMLQADPKDRFEDFDELDECLEIALSKISNGDLELQKELDYFAEHILNPKIKSVAGIGYKERSLETSRDCWGLPFEKSVDGSRKKRSTKMIVACSVGFVLFLIAALWALFVHTDADIDATGASLLKRSRDYIQVTNDEPDGKRVPDSVQVNTMLKDLPTPIGKEE